MALTFTVDHFSGITGSSCVSGSISGSFSGSACGFTGSLINFTGTLSGKVSGSYVVATNKFNRKRDVYLKRSILKFDLTEISKSISNNDILNPKFFLNLKVVESTEVPLDYTIYAFPLSQSWDMGTGLFANGGSTDGVNWLYRNASSASNWYPDIDTTLDISDINYLDYPSTASFLKGGGTWYYSAPDNCENGDGFCATISASSYICSQSFQYTTSDLNIDITPICKAWICGCIPNEGVILMTSDELNPTATSNLKFFSRETNTIHSPYIDVKWDDSLFLTGGLNPVTSSLGVSVTIRNLQKEYKSGAVIKLNVFARELNQIKQFVTVQSNYTIPKYLPTSSYYSIKDNESESIIVDFDEYTKLSCDSFGNYFYLDTTALAQERYYKILIKSEFDDGSIQIFDDMNVFKIKR